MEYILHGINYQTLIMMISDAPRYIDGKKKSKNDNRSAEEEANDIVGFFRSNLKQ